MAVGTAKDEAGRDEFVEVRRLDRRVAQGVDCVGKLVVGEEEEDIGLLLRGVRGVRETAQFSKATVTARRSAVSWCNLQRDEAKFDIF